MSDQDDIFDAALRILLFADRCMTVSITPGGVSIRLPTTRKLAEYLDVPHYYVLPAYAAMEQDGLIRRVERVGISTTPEGTRCLLRMMETTYADAAEEVLGVGMLAELLRKMKIKPDQTTRGRYQDHAPTGRPSLDGPQSPDTEGEDEHNAVSD